MKPISNWNEIAAEGDGMRTRLEAGGYVARITKVVDVPEKEYLKVVYDIAEGPEAGRFATDWGKNPDNDYAHSFARSYKEKARGMFKGFINVVEASNEGYKWDWKEAKLVGKLIGVVLGYEEYMSNRGEIATKLSVRSVVEPAKIRAGEFIVPDVKRYKLKAENASEGQYGPHNAPPAYPPVYSASEEFTQDQDIPF